MDEEIEKINVFLLETKKEEQAMTLTGFGDFSLIDKWKLSQLKSSM